MGGPDYLAVLDSSIVLMFYCYLLTVYLTLLLWIDFNVTFYGSMCNQFGLVFSGFVFSLVAESIK